MSAPEDPVPQLDEAPQLQSTEVVSSGLNAAQSRSLGASLLGMADVASGLGRGLAALVLRAAGQTMMAPPVPARTRQQGVLTRIDLEGPSPELGKLYRLIYVSRASAEDSEEASRRASAILDKARHHNAMAGLTGALVHSKAWFGQVLEGELVEVERLFARISKDPRHSEVHVLAMRPIRKRAFGSWAMASAGEAPDQLIQQSISVISDRPALNAAVREMMSLLRNRLTRRDVA